MQEHEYKARDKTVQKMSRDGLREENLRNKEEKRITGRDTDTEISRSEKKEELDFSKRRHERLKEEREMEQPEQSSRKPRYSREHVSDQDINSDMGEEVEIEGDISVENGENPKSAFRTESIRGQPRGERAYLETVADSRDLRKKKMVRDYAAKERRKEKETSREEKAAKRESARYRETSEVMEDSLDKFHEEIKGKSKRERVLKEQRKKVSRLSFGDEGDGMVHGAGIGIRNPASAVKDAAVTAAHWKTHEEEDENAAVEGAHRAELVGESLARKSIYMRERLKGRREESRRLKESVLDEAERSRLIFETAYGNEAKDAVKREAEKKKKSALQKLFQKKRYQKQYQAARQSKKVKDAAITSAQKFTEKAKDAVKMVAAQNRGIFATVAVFALIFVLIAASFTSCTASLQGASSAIISTSYSSTDEDIYAAENAYRALEEALNTQINQMESTHPDYDEYRYQIDEIGHNPYQLISYLTVKYGGFTYDEVAEEIKEIFRQQYGITTDSTRETVSSGFGYDIPADALSDPQFAKMIQEAEKYLGVPYVWGGYSPSGFDCSGFVSWVINNCGNGWNVGRCTADELRSHCSQVSPSEAKPGDLIFFQGTYDTPGASHVGIYVGNNMMIHCGKPVQYTSIASAYWQEHFMAFGRLH